jgi:hypothetical protein
VTITNFTSLSVGAIMMIAGRAIVLCPPTRGDLQMTKNIMERVRRRATRTKAQPTPKYLAACRLACGRALALREDGTIVIEVSPGDWELLDSDRHGNVSILELVAEARGCSLGRG